MSVDPAGQQPGDDCISLQSDEGCSILNPARLHAFPLHHPSRRQCRLREIGQDGVGLVGIDSGIAMSLRFRGQSVPGRLDVGPGFRQSRERVVHIPQYWFLRCRHLRCWLPGCGSDLHPSPDLGQLITNGSSQFLESGHRSCVLLRGIGGSTPPARRHEHRSESVVIFLRDRFEFMVMTAGTGDRRCQEDLGKGVDLVVHHFLMNTIELQAAAVAMLSHMVKHRPDDALVNPECLIDARLGQQVSSELFAEQSVKTNILIEGSNQVVAVLMRSLGRVVPFISVGIRVPNHVHPVPGEGLAVVRRRE